LPCRIGGEINGFDPDAYINGELKANRMGRFAQLAVAAALMAVEDSALDLASLRGRTTVPAVMGVSTSAMDLFAKRPSAFTGPSSLPHAAGCAVATALGLRMRLVTLSSACASSLDAVWAGAMMIRRNETNLVLAGGSDSAMTHYVFEGIAKSRMLSSRNEEPERASRPFDRDRDGGLISEGAGIVVLENLDCARARGAPVYAEVVGQGSAFDSLGDEEACGLEMSMRLALANGARRKEDIDAVSAHGPSDKHLDAIETAMIKKVFGKAAYRIPVTSIKGVTGNPFGAAGIHQIIAACMSLRDGMIPPTANLENPDPDCDLDYVADSPRMYQPESVMVNSHGAGRVNSSMILERIKDNGHPWGGSTNIGFTSDRCVWRPDWSGKPW